VLPGGGGIQLDLFYPAVHSPGEEARTGQRGVVVNPRGIRAYVHTDTFFKAIPKVLARLPETRFVCPAMAGEPQALGWLEALNIAGSVELLPHLTRAQMADLFRQAQVMVSPSTHDGTPNSLLEARACGCLPVAGDLESIREWITPGVNGLLVDPGDPQALAQAILQALEQPDLRARAAQINYQLVADKAEYGKVMKAAEMFYQQIVWGSEIS
jgi:glycosyltransferase involved in cell wall biosynthesis